MSEPAYHLRTNKYVERRLFVDLLRHLSPGLPAPITHYPYIGLGGPYLADFALLQDEFGFRQMTSLETESHVQRRQQFNLPHCRVTASRNSTRDFVESFVGRNPAIVWFDYSEPLWRDQIAESCELIVKMSSLSIFKITLACVVSGRSPLGRGGVEDRLEKLEDMFGDYGPFDKQAVLPKNLPKTLYGVLRQAIASLFGDNPDHAVRTLASFVYSDGTPILTVTVAVGEIAAIDTLIEGSAIRDWPFADLDWSGPRLVDVPILTMRERLAVDRFLPDADATAILRKVDVALSAKREDVIKALRQYITYRRYMPFFVDIRTCN